MSCAVAQAEQRCKRANSFRSVVYQQAERRTFQAKLARANRVLIPNFEAGPRLRQGEFGAAADQDGVVLLLHGVRIVESRAGLNVLAAALCVCKIVVKKN